MKLQIFLPTEILVDAGVTKIVAEAEDGSFCLLPRHTNFVSSLTAGILTFTDENKIDRYVGTTSGLLVKTGAAVAVSTEHAVQGDNLGELRDIVRQRFELIDDRERQAVSAVARLEADFVRRFMDIEERPHVGI